jgi:hypothetical protein
MKRIKVHDDPPRKQKSLARIRCDDSKPRGLKRVKVPASPEQIEADEFVQYHLAQISDAKETERNSWAEIAAYLAETAPANFE